MSALAANPYQRFLPSTLPKSTLNTTEQKTGSWLLAIGIWPKAKIQS
jgi:hypothetical protein